MSTLKVLAEIHPNLAESAFWIWSQTLATLTWAPFQQTWVRNAHFLKLSARKQGPTYSCSAKSKPTLERHKIFERRQPIFFWLAALPGGLNSYFLWTKVWFAACLFGKSKIQAKFCMLFLTFTAWILLWALLKCQLLLEPEIAYSIEKYSSGF